MNEESDLLKAEREDEERREILEDVLKEIELFNLKQDEEDVPDNSQNEDNSSETDVLHPPGIKFFEDYVNRLYNEESIRPESFSKLFEDIKDISSFLEDIELMVRYDIQIDSLLKKNYIKYFFKLLFMEQSDESLHIISSILLEMLNKNSHPNVLLRMFIEELPSGIANLGGRVDVIYSEEETPSSMSQTPRHWKKQFSPLLNLKHILDVFKYTIVKGEKSKQKVMIEVPEIEQMFFVFMVMSHDPVVLNSSLVAAVQEFIATVLDLYPSDLTFQENVQELVEKLAIYWEDSPLGFNHHTAYYVTCNVLPASRRGQHLKGSLAYYALMCCLTPIEEVVEVVDFVPMSKLSEVCQKHVDEIKALDFYTLFSVIKLIDAAIERPFDKSTNKEHLVKMKEILITNVSSKSHDVSDIYNSTRLNIFFKEVKSEWDRLMNNRKEEMEQLTIPTIVAPRHSKDDYSEPFH